MHMQLGHDCVGVRLEVEEVRWVVVAGSSDTSKQVTLKGNSLNLPRLPSAACSINLAETLADNHMGGVRLLLGHSVVL